MDGANVPDLRAAVVRAAGIAEPAGRALEVVALIDQAMGGSAPHPVVVGGMAVYYWTANDAFLTADIDLVVPTSARFVDALASLGFARSTDGRHWELPGTEVLVEAPASRLDPGTTIEFVEAPSGHIVGVLSHADVLLDRLAEFQATGHQIVAQQVLVLLAALPDANAAELERKAATRRVVSALKGMSALVDDIDAARRPVPDSGEWHELARRYERAEYHRSPDES